jgi:nucleoside-diphosphate kinase
MQQTLTIIKPDGMAAGNAGRILAHLEGAGFEIVALKRIRLSEVQARGFYQVHEDKPFYLDLVRFMTESPVIVAVLQREDAVPKLREVMGATNSKEAAAGTIRALYGTDIERNAIHGSDSIENAAKEAGFFFSRAELLELG